MADTLLLADDSVTIQRVIELTFASEGIRVITVADGNAATSRLEDDRPDIVLADVGLPAVDGYEIAERIKGSPALASIPVLLLTGAFESIDEARARATGCDGVLVKPFDPGHLVGVVKELLAGKHPDHLWPTDVPRIDAPPRVSLDGRPHQEVEQVRPAHPGRAASSDFGPPPQPSVVEDVFEKGLDDLDMAFSRLDPVAPPSALDAAIVSDFRRDIQELRSESPAAGGPAVTPLPGEQAPPVDHLDLDWDLLPTPSTVTESSPVAAEFPIAPEPAAAGRGDIEEVVRRVVTRIMTDEVVRTLVSETTERLIREEMDRLKR